MVAIEKVDLYIGMSIAGLFTGLGSAIGIYLAQTHFIKTFEKIKKKRRKLFKK
jgi:uncharacterized protein (DUF2062 family)